MAALRQAIDSNRVIPAGVYIVYGEPRRPIAVSTRPPHAFVGSGMVIVMLYAI